MPRIKKGATVPTGSTEFQFRAGDLNFHSDAYQWLVVAGDKAQYKGTGTINASKPDLSQEWANSGGRNRTS